MQCKRTAFVRGVTGYPHPGDPVYFVDDPDIAVMFSPQGVPHIHIGNVHPSRNVRAPLLFDKLLSRHFAVVGSTGTGKSTLVSMILNRIISVAPDSHVVILDPHGEYLRSFGENAQRWSVDNLKIPYWAMNLAEHCDAFVTSRGESRIIESNILANALTQARRAALSIGDQKHVTADSPIPYQIGDLLDALEAEQGKLSKPAASQHYTFLRMTIEQMFSDQRFGFIFNPDLWDASLSDFLSDILRVPTNGKPVSIIDLVGVPSEIVSVVVSSISRLIFDLAIHSRRSSRIPMLLVCEEAHRYLPRERPVWESGAERQLDRIAREGRKYGLSLCLVTQRPSELSETALSQCGTIFAMRLGNRQDQDQLRAVFSESGASLNDAIATMRNQECIVAGEGVPLPMHIVIDDQARSEMPDSEDPEFSRIWSVSAGTKEGIEETILRWRGNT